MHSGTYPRRLNVALFFAVGSYSTLQSIIIPVLPDIAARFDSPPQEAAWLVSGFLMIGAAVTPIAGRVGDLLGPVRTLIVVLAIFVAGAVLAIVADSMLALIVARMLQGLGAAAVALSFSIIKSRYPPQRAAGAVGMISATMAAAAGLGLSLSGVISVHLGYHAIFVLPLLVSLTSIALLLAQVRLDPPPRRGLRQVNWTGGVLFAVGMALVLLAITQGNAWGWLATPTVITLVGGIGVMAAWAWVESKARSPLIDVRLIVSPRLLRINVTTLLVGMVMFSTYTLMPAFLQARTPDGFGLGLDVTTTGLIMLPIAVMNFLSGTMAGPTTSAIGSRNMLVLGVSVNIVGLIFITALHDHPLQIVATCALHGAAVGLAFASMPALTMQAVHSDDAGVAAGIYNTLRSVGGAIGTQIAFGILASDGTEPTGNTFRMVLVFLFVIGVAALVSALSIPRGLVGELRAKNHSA